MTAPFGADESRRLLVWSAGGIVNPRYAEREALPTLGELARLRLMDLVLAAEPNAKRARRMLTARAHLAARLWRPLGEESAQVATEADGLHEQIRGRLPEAMCLSLLVTALVDGPFAPFQIQVKSDDLLAALQHFAADLGVPKTWADVAAKAARDTAPTLNPFGSPLGTLPTPAMPAPEFEAGVRMLHAVALAKMRLRPATPVNEIAYLERLRAALEGELELHEAVDDPRSSPAHTLKRKIRALSAALTALSKEAKK